MYHRAMLVVGLGFLAVLVCAGASQADGRKAGTPAQTVGERKAAHYRKRGTRVRGYSQGARLVVLHGGYAYGRSDVIGTYATTRAPYLWVDQSPGGAFDSGLSEIESDAAAIARPGRAHEGPVGQVSAFDQASHFSADPTASHS